MERRRYRRFPADGGLYAAFIQQGEPIVCGRIVDIGHGGVGIRYLAEKPLGKAHISIQIVSTESILLGRMRSTIVFDSETEKTTGDVITERRCGVKFDKPTSSIMSLIKSEK